MITLHHLEYSQSFRILWLLEELGVKYELKKYKRDKKTFLAPPEYKALSPTTGAPVITDGSLVLAESNAIIDYILDKYGNNRLRPPAGSSERASYLFWFHAAQGTMMPLMTMDSTFRIIRSLLPSLLRPIFMVVPNKIQDKFMAPRLKNLFDIAEKDLEKSGWFAGGEALSAADIVMAYNMQSSHHRDYLTEEYPRCRQWLERVYAHPSFIKAKALDGNPTMVPPLQKL